jgi:hypothetical protein
LTAVWMFNHYLYNVICVVVVVAVVVVVVIVCINYDRWWWCCWCCCCCCFYAFKSSLFFFNVTTNDLSRNPLQNSPQGVNIIVEKARPFLNSLFFLLLKRPSFRYCLQKMKLTLRSYLFKIWWKICSYYFF